MPKFFILYQKAGILRCGAHHGEVPPTLSYNGKLYHSWAGEHLGDFNHLIENRKLVGFHFVLVDDEPGFALSRFVQDSGNCEFNENGLFIFLSPAGPENLDFRSVNAHWIYRHDEDFILLLPDFLPASIDRSIALNASEDQPRLNDV